MRTREAIERAIVDCLRSGAVYRYCDTDGYHDEVAYRDGRYVHVDGFRAVSNPPNQLVDEAAVVALVRTIRPRAPGASEHEVLETILASLLADAREAGRPEQ